MFEIIKQLWTLPKPDFIYDIYVILFRLYVMDKTMAGPLAHREVPFVTFEECDVDAFIL